MDKKIEEILNQLDEIDIIKPELFKDYLSDKQLDNYIIEYINKNNLLAFKNKNDEKIILKGNYLKLFLFLNSSLYKEEIMGVSFSFIIPIEELENLLSDFKIQKEMFFYKIQHLRIEYFEKDGIFSIKFKYFKIYSNYSNFIKKLEFQNARSNMLKIIEMENKVDFYKNELKKIEEKINNLNKDIEKAKIDYIAILGVFVCVFTLISTNFSFLKSSENIMNINEFIKFEIALITSLASLLIMIRFFIYKERYLLLVLILIIIIFFLLLIK